MAQSMTLLERFSRNYIPEPNSGCWLWLGHVPEGKYGLFRMTSSAKERAIGAHRASYLIHCGGIPKGMLICHKCDVPSCVNPDHLFVGTYSDNNQDAAAKGRSKWKPGRDIQKLPRGSSHHQAKLSEDDVKFIILSNEKGVDLAKKFGVTPTQICRIRRRKAWNGTVS